MVIIILVQVFYVKSCLGGLANKLNSNRDENRFEDYFRRQFSGNRAENE